MITEGFLLNIAGAKKLDQIQTLNLSNKGLNDKDLENAKDVFVELIALDHLDLSGNQLTKFPDVTFCDCQMLNVSHNNIREIDDSSTSWTLEEVDIRGNPAIDINEKYKLRELVPKLKVLDGETLPEKDALQSIRQQLQNRISKMLDESFKNEIPDEAEKEKFLRRAKRTPAGPSSLRKFRTWLAERVAKQLLVARESDSKEEEINEDLSFYKNLKRNRGMLGGPTTTTSCGDYQPFAALQCHSQHPKMTDIQIWAIGFEPDVVRNNETTSIFGSCGGDAICFTNVKTGRVTNKFVEPEESFFCCSWSSDPEKPLVQRESIIAVGGKFGVVYIIKPHGGSCIHRIKAIRGLGTINSVKFAFPKYPDLLFVAPAVNDSLKNVISGWKIHTNGNSCQKLIELEGMNASPVKMCLPNLETGLSKLFCSTDDGIRVWDISGAEKASKERRNVSATLYHPNLPDDSIVDTIIQLDKDHLLSKVAGSGVIFIWTLDGVESEISANTGDDYVIEPAKLLNWSDTEEVYLNIFVNNGIVYAGDEEGQVWKYEPDLTLDGAEFQDASAVIPWPIVKRTTTENVPLEKTIINDIATPANGNYLVAATNNNIVLILKGAFRI